MIQPWLDSLHYVWHAPAIIERRCVPRARARLQQCTLNMPCITDKKQLLLDVSVICRHDAGTGIQRIVRAVLKQMLTDDHPAGYVVRPVAATSKQPYRFLEWDGVAAMPAWGGKIRIRPGDIFLGLDLSAHLIPAHRRQLAEWKTQGATLHFIVYDLLPLHHPEWFSGKLVAAFRRWIKAVAILADSAICISRTVEAELVAWFGDRYGFAPGTVSTRVIPMGWDLASTKPSQGLPPNFEQILLQIQQRKTVLMVGTIEPRKGHADVLAAFDILWRQGGDINFVIVGRPGWKTEALQTTLRSHPQNGERLFWLEDASDEALTKLYTACDGVVVASFAEGFGLPLIEALSHGKPVLARDLPVFRLYEAKGVCYFAAGIEPAALAQSIKEWFKMFRGEFVQDPLTIPSWADTARAILVPLTVGRT